MRSRLRTTPKRAIPKGLQARLRIAGSHEAVRRRSHATWQAYLRMWQENCRLWVSGLMRPFAIPAFGGILSAVLLFTAISPYLTVRAMVNEENDVPTGLFTEAGFKRMVPLAIQEREIIVEVTIDENGRMTDYHIQNSQALRKSPALRRSIENTLLFTLFTPATSFGKATSGKVRIWFQTSSIDVKG